MSLRDYFAAAALTGAIASTNDPAIQKAMMKTCTETNTKLEDAFARIAYGCADAMLAAREKRNA